MARSISSLYHSEQDVKTVERKFELQVQRKEVPDDVLVLNVPEPSFDLADFLVANGIVSSKGQVKRLITQKGIKVNGKPIDHSHINISGQEIVLRVGKKQLVKIRLAE